MASRTATSHVPRDVDDGRPAQHLDPRQPGPVRFVVINQERGTRVTFDVAKAGEVCAALRLFIDGNEECVIVQNEADRHEMRPAIRRDRPKTRHGFATQKRELPILPLDSHRGVLPRFAARTRVA